MKKIRYPAFIFFTLFVPLTFFIIHRDDFAYPIGSPYTDLLISHFPNAVYFKQAITTFGQIPLWSDLIMSGYPFVADPLSGLWYPPGWLAEFFPSAASFNLSIMLHLLLGGVGAYLWLKKRTRTDFGALIGALTFELMPKLWAHYASGHITLVYAVSWTPWLLLADDSWRDINRIVRFYPWPGLIFTMVILADVRWAAYLGVLWISYSLIHLIQDLTHPRDGGFKSQVIQGANWAFRFAAQVIIAVTLAAPFLLPFIQFVGQTTRSGLSPDDAFALSLPLASLFGLFYPDFGGYSEWLVYPGAFALVSLVGTLSIPRLAKKLWYWWLLIFICLILSLGQNLPLIDSIFLLPGLNLLRVPPRILFLAGLGFAVISAQFSDVLFYPHEKFNWRWFNLFLAGLTLLICGLAIGMWLYNQKISLELIWGGVSFFCFAILYTIKRRTSLAGRWLMPVATALLAANLFGVCIGQVSFRSSTSVGFEQSAQIGVYPSNSSRYRIYSPSYSLAQDSAAIGSLELASGVHPLQIRNYVAYMEKATGVPNTAYEVTIPQFSNGDPKTANKSFVPDAFLLGKLNVCYVVSAYELEATGLVLFSRLGDTYLYKNLFYRSRAWVQESENGFTEVPSDKLIWTPNHINLEATGPGLLVLSEVNYPGWTVKVDGVLQPMVIVDGIFRGVYLDAGSHKIEYFYRPVSLYIGAVIAFLMAITIVVLKGLGWW